MSDEDKDSKTELPTEKKIRDAMEKGNTPFSREITIFASTLAIYLYLVFFLPGGLSRMNETLRDFFEQPEAWNLKSGTDVIAIFRHLGGGQHAVGAAVVVDGRTGDDGENLVTVAAGVGDALEHDHAATLGAGVAVGVGAERLDAAVRRQDAADHVEADRHHRGHQGVDATGHDDVGLAGAQCLHALVHRDQR